MFELKTSASFDSAHFLSGYQGKCANLHGHRWKIEVTVGKETLQEEGNYRDMVIDFGDEKLSSDGLPVRRVAVYETPENCAVYEV